MTMGGEPTDLPADVELVPLHASQPYLLAVESHLVELVGRPAFLLHDKETGTSDLVVSDLICALHDGLDVKGMVVAAVMRSCFDNAIPFRIWWAGGDDSARNQVNNVREVKGLAAALEALLSGDGVLAL